MEDALFFMPDCFFIASLSSPLAWRPRRVQAKLHVQKCKLEGFLCYGIKNNKQYASVITHPSAKTQTFTFIRQIIDYILRRLSQIWLFITHVHDVMVHL